MPTVADLAELLWAHRPPGSVYVIGLTGGVAAGKTTLAAGLAEALEAGATRPRVERIGADGFLHPNAVLIEKGILERKGFPESYDRTAMHEALRSVRSRAVTFPGYSHLIYDVDPAEARTVSPPDVLIIEGLGLDRDTPVDTLVYLDAEEGDQEAWFVTRFLAFWEVGRKDPSSFYARFRDLDRDAAAQLGARVWTSINRPNLREHIAPLRACADIIVTKGTDHGISAIVRGKV
jgi:type I pantothenate kinase